MPLKFHTYCMNLKKFLVVQMSEQARILVDDVGLLPLMDCLLTMLDAPLFPAFIK